MITQSDWSQFKEPTSIAALAQLNDPEDIAYLQELARSDNKLRFAAQEALKNQTKN